MDGLTPDSRATKITPTNVQRQGKKIVYNSKQKTKLRKKGENADYTQNSFSWPIQIIIEDKRGPFV